MNELKFVESSGPGALEEQLCSNLGLGYWLCSLLPERDWLLHRSCLGIYLIGNLMSNSYTYVSAVGHSVLVWFKIVVGSFRIH